MLIDAPSIDPFCISPISGLQSRAEALNFHPNMIHPVAAGREETVQNKALKRLENTCLIRPQRLGRTSRPDRRRVKNPGRKRVADGRQTSLPLQSSLGISQSLKVPSGFSRMISRNVTQNQLLICSVGFICIPQNKQERTTSSGVFTNDKDRTDRVKLKESLQTTGLSSVFIHLFL